MKTKIVAFILALVAAITVGVEVSHAKQPTAAMIMCPENTMYQCVEFQGVKYWMNQGYNTSVYNLPGVSWENYQCVLDNSVPLLSGHLVAKQFKWIVDSKGSYSATDTAYCYPFE